MLTAIPRYGARVIPNTEQTIDELRKEGQLVHGGWGYAEEFAISRHVVDALVLPIFEGVKPILELKVIARALLAQE